MSSDSEESIKDIVNTEQEEFRLKGADDYPYTFDDLCFDHQKVASPMQPVVNGGQHRSHR